MKLERSEVTLLSSLALFTVLVHAVVNAHGGYGYFRDELYYLACADHLDWGYVDHPPLSIAILFLSRTVFGDSLFAIRLLPALAGGATVFLTGWMARAFGAGRPGIVLSCLAVSIAPVYLGLFGIFSMNAFDVLFWNIVLVLLIRIFSTGETRLWIWFGLAVGLGLQNKLSMGFLCCGIAAGLLFTPQRLHLRSRHFWLGAAVASLLFLPHLLWQVAHGWPTLEFMQHARVLKNLPLSPAGFFLGMMTDHHPLTFPLWITGFFVLLLSTRFAPFRPIAIAAIVIFLILVLQQGKVYYISPLLPVLMAAGGSAIERFAAGPRWRWAIPASSALLLVGGTALAPIALPILPVETFIRYYDALGVEGAGTGERHEMGALPQFYADMFGWEEKAEAVARAYRTLTPEEQSRCGIFSDNYGRCAAIDFFGKRYGLPPAMGNHNNYWLWGPKPESPAVVLILGGQRADHERLFASVTAVERVQCNLCMPYESNLQVFVCRGPKGRPREMWNSIRSFI